MASTKQPACQLSLGPRLALDFNKNYRINNFDCKKPFQSMTKSVVNADIFVPILPSPLTWIKSRFAVTNFVT